MQLHPIDDDVLYSAPVTQFRSIMLTTRNDANDASGSKGILLVSSIFRAFDLTDAMDVHTKDFRHIVVSQPDYQSCPWSLMRKGHSMVS